MPFFSVVIPTYNRAKLIGRALDSVLSQDFADFEIVVVDSASTDATRDVVRSYADPRVRLICEEERRGVCPARNLAIDASVGEWIVTLDSDDELLPGMLSTFRRKAEEAGPEIGRLRFMCLWDNGRTTPDPPLEEEEWGYEDFLRFVHRTATGNSETMSCTRRSTFEHVRYPEDRAYEVEYHYAFAKRFRTRTYPIVARLYHSDAEDQNSYIPNPRHWLRVAPDNARSLDRVIDEHGATMRRVAPRAYNATLRVAAKYHFLAGDRRGGMAMLMRLWRVDPLSLPGMGLFIFGNLGPNILARVDAWRMGQRRREVLGS